MKTKLHFPFFCLFFLFDLKVFAQPVITLKGKDTAVFIVHEAYTSAGATAYDSIDGDLTSKIYYFTDLDTGVTGLYTEEYHVKNSRGQSDFKVRTLIVVNDIKPPMLNLTGPDTIYIEADRHNPPYEDYGATSPGNPGGLFSNVVISHMVNSKRPGIYKVKLMVQDVMGQQTIKYRTVIVQDTRAPIWNDTSSVYLLKADKPFRHKVRLYDQFDLNVHFGFSHPSTGPVDTSKPGRYDYIYTGQDSSGNAADTLRLSYYIIRDTTAPVLSLKGTNPLMIQYNCTNGSYKDPGISALDMIDGDLTYAISMSGNVNTLKLGTYQLNYRVSDSSGNTSQLIRTVIVHDKQAPEIILSQRSVQLQTNVPYTPHIPTVMDDGCPSSLIPTMIFTDFNTKLPGIYTEVWSVTDASGNKSPDAVLTITVSKFVSVEDIPADGLTLYPFPVINVLNISISNSEASPVIVELLTLDGHRLYVEVFNTLNDHYSIDLSNFAPGLYIIHIQAGGITYRTKIVKE